MTLSTNKILYGESGYDGFCYRIAHKIPGLYDFFVFSSLLLSVECVAMAFVSCVIQQVPWNPLIALIPFLSAFSIYNLNRKTDEVEDAINHKERFAFTKRFETPLFRLAILAFLLAMTLAAPAGIPALLATAAPFLCGFLYSFRWLPEKSRYRRLKEVPGVKNCVVGFAWGILLALLPIYLNAGVPDTKTIVTFVLFFLWGFMASLIPDIRDREGDTASGVMSLPVILGTARAKILLSGIILLLGLPLITYSIVALPPATTVLLLAACLYSYACVHLLKNQGIIDFVADCISDGQYIPFALLIAVIPIMGQVFGLVV